MKTRLIISYPELRAAQIFARIEDASIFSRAKASALIDTDGSIWGIGDANMYVSPKCAELNISHPISLDIPDKAYMSPETSVVSVKLGSEISDTPVMAEMVGHDSAGNPIYSNWLGIYIRNANEKEIKKLEAVKEIIKEVGATAYYAGPITLVTSALQRVWDSIDYPYSVKPKQIRAPSFKLTGESSPIMINLGCPEGKAIIMPGISGVFDNDESYES